jgi:hypothetical protein
MNTTAIFDSTAEQLSSPVCLEKGRGSPFSLDTITIAKAEHIKLKVWLIRSASVIYYVIDPSRSAAVPGAHFKGLSQDQGIIVCDRYSAYKKLARLLPIILLAFCWARVRREFLNAGKAFAEFAD